MRVRCIHDRNSSLLRMSWLLHLPYAEPDFGALSADGTAIVSSHRRLPLGPVPATDRGTHRKVRVVMNMAGDHMQAGLASGGPPLPPADAPAMLAHELRRRVAAARVLLEAVALTVAAERDPQPLLARLGGEIGDLDGLARGLLERHGASRGVDVAAVASAAVDTVRLAHGADVRLCAAPAAPQGGVDGSGGRLRVRCDARLLRQALENLIENAVRHGGGGAVQVIVRPAGRSPADGVEVLVLDRGLRGGQAARGHAAAGPKGYGLGLALVRRFAEASGSRLWVGGRAGGGSAVRLWLPPGGGAGRQHPIAGADSEREAG